MVHSISPSVETGILPRGFFSTPVNPAADEQYNNTRRNSGKDIVKELLHTSTSLSGDSEDYPLQLNLLQAKLDSRRSSRHLRLGGRCPVIYFPGQRLLLSLPTILWKR
jgi:hypothetical protein